MQNQSLPLIQVENLYKCFDDVAVLNNISVQIEEGDLVSVIGPSGCGKSTFLRCLNCLEVFDSGRIIIDGIELKRQHIHEPLSSQFLNEAHRLRQHVGMVFQSFNLFAHKTLFQNILMPLTIVQGKSLAEAEFLAAQMLKKVGLQNLEKRYPASLSGGQKQRAAIARALAMNPKVMLYDEPTSSIDPERVDEVLQVMRDLDAEGMTQIIVTHEMRFARDASDYIIYMEQGELIEISDEDEIFISPKDDRTRRFLKCFM